MTHRQLINHYADGTATSHRTARSALRFYRHKPLYTTYGLEVIPKSDLLVWADFERKEAARHRRQGL